jgi:predicted nuclease of predicted toxin-antitoxin system
VRILIDECVHIGVKRAFNGHLVKTVNEIGWRSIKDGPLLMFAQDEFDVFVTIDRNLERHRISPS